MREILHFLKELILAVIAWTLQPIVEVATFIVVLFQHGWSALHYFDEKGYRLDVMSARANRSLWNLLFVKKGGYQFTKDTKMSISRILGINTYIGTLTITGKILCVILSLIDYSSWRKGGHCKNAIEGDDWDIILNKIDV